MGKQLNQFNVGDVVTNNDGEVFEIKQFFKTGRVKVFVKECNSIWTYNDINGKEIKKEKTYTVEIDSDVWELVSSNDSNIQSDDITKFEKNIEKMQNELNEAKKSLEQMKKKKIPELIVGEMYVAPNGHNYLSASKILILSIDRGEVKFIQFYDEPDSEFEIIKEYISDVNDGTLIHMNSSEQKKFSKQLFELTKHYA